MVVQISPTGQELLKKIETNKSDEFLEMQQLLMLLSYHKVPVYFKNKGKRSVLLYCPNLIRVFYILSQNQAFLMGKQETLDV